MPNAVREPNPDLLLRATEHLMEKDVELEALRTENRSLRELVVNLSRIIMRKAIEKGS